MALVCVTCDTGKLIWGVSEMDGKRLLFEDDMCSRWSWWKFLVVISIMLLLWLMAICGGGDADDN